jgi:hypothetical protein
MHYCILPAGAGIFTQPERPFKNASFSQWPVCTKVANVSCMACTGPKSSRAVLDSMGYSIRFVATHSIT